MNIPWRCAALLIAPLLFGCVRKADAPPRPNREVVKPVARPTPPKKEVSKPGPFPEDLARSTFKVQTRGTFSTKPSWDVNLINAPASAYKRRPAMLKVDAAVLDALNKGLWMAFRKVMKRRKMTIAPGAPRAEKLTGPTGDRHFALLVEVGPNNGLGGHASGVTFDVTLTSRHRDAKKHSAVARETVAARKADAALAELEQKLDRAVDEVFVSFQKGLISSAVEAAKPQPFFVLVVKLDNLDDRQRAHARGVVQCLFRQGWTTGAKARKSPQGMMRYAVHYAVTDDSSAAKIVDGIARSFAATAGGHGKNRCSLWRTTLEGFETRAVARPAGKQITISWVKSKKKKSP